MKKYIAYLVAALVLVGMFSACTADELEPEKKPMETIKGDSFIGIDPINPNWPRP